MDGLDYKYLAGLVRKTQDGDETAFAELYAASYQRQYHFTLRLVKDSRLAQDILQDVYVTALNSVHSLNNPGMFLPWLSQINFRACFDALQNLSDGAKDTPDSADTALMSSILSLPPEEAQAVILRYYNDMSPKEVAVAMYCSRRKARKRLRSGRKAPGVSALSSLSKKDGTQPDLDLRAANRILDSVFAACNMNLSVIPVEILTSWGNFKKPDFRPVQFISAAILLILILLPVWFLSPSVVAERTDVASATNAVYNIHIKSLLPLRFVSASLDGEPVSLSRRDKKDYSAELTENGEFVITAVSLNGQITSRTYEVSYLDMEKPEFIESYVKDGKLYLVVRDTYSGINYSEISGLEPESYNADENIIIFKVPEEDVTVIIPDNAGNLLSLKLSPVNKNEQ